MVAENDKFNRVKVSEETFRIVRRAATHCPRLYQLLVSGVKESKQEERLYKARTTKVCLDMVLRFWRYADFELDYELAQNFNNEILILDKAKRKDCMHIARMDDMFFTSYAFLMHIKRYDMDLR